MSVDPGTERIRRLNREAARESGPDDPKPTRPRDAKRVFAILAAAIVIAAVVLGWMFFNNVRYDGTSPAPIAERPK